MCCYQSLGKPLLGRIPYQGNWWPFHCLGGGPSFFFFNDFALCWWGRKQLPGSFMSGSGPDFDAHPSSEITYTIQRVAGGSGSQRLLAQGRNNPEWGTNQPSQCTLTCTHTLWWLQLASACVWNVRDTRASREDTTVTWSHTEPWWNFECSSQRCWPLHPHAILRLIIVKEPKVHKLNAL